MCSFPIGALFTSGYLGNCSNTFTTYTSHDRYLSEYLKPRPAHLTHPFWGNPIVSSSPNMKLNVRFIIQRTGSFWNAKETHPPKKLVSFMHEQIIWGLGLKNDYEPAWCHGPKRHFFWATTPHDWKWNLKMMLFPKNGNFFYPECPFPDFNFRGL